MTKANPTDLSDVMTIGEIAQNLRVTIRTVQRWCMEGRFPNAYRVGRPWRVPKADVDAFIIQLTEQMTREAK